MIRSTDKQIVIDIFNSALGVGTPLNNGDVAYHCPFCHHHKKKLIINIITQGIHCFVCNARGRNLKSFSKRIGLSRNAIDKISNIYNSDDTFEPLHQEKIILRLPPEFKKLSIKPKSINTTYSTCINYLYERGVNMNMIMKWNIGYCDTGRYANRIIVPSYDVRGELNFFISRSVNDDAFLRYILSPISRDVIIFENQINWKEPITIVEGVFDAFSVRRNVIPLLSKNLLPTLRDKILLERPPLINICLDNDAVRESVEYSNFFLKNGLIVKNVIPEAKDIGEMTFTDTINLLKNTKLSDWSSLLKSKLNTI